MQNKFKKYRNFLYKYMLFADGVIECKDSSISAKIYMQGRHDAFFLALKEFNDIFDKEINTDE